MRKLINTYLGQYLILDIVGRGSTSIVYKALQPSLNRFVAVKVLLSNLGPQLASRFKREAYAIAQLQHPNILPIYDYGVQNGMHYFVMQYIESGVTLHDLLADGPMEQLAALRLIEHLLSALDYAHQRGVIHRDIKPSNILMLRPDWPILADFGIAKLLDDNKELTPANQAVGTAVYMAPERASSGPGDARSDLYSTGIVLYEMVTGRVPFDANTPLAVLLKHVHEPLPPPRSINPQVDPAVEAVLLRALAKNPDARYQTAHEMAEEVHRASAQVERSQMLSQLMSREFGAPAPLVQNPYKTDKLADTGAPAVAPSIQERPPLMASAGRPALQAPVEPDLVEPAWRDRGMLGKMAVVVLALAVLGTLAAMIGLSALSGLAARASTPTPAVPPTAVTSAGVFAPTAPPVPTETPAPTNTPALIPTPAPTDTPAPTAKPPTATRVPPTPVPAPTVVVQPAQAGITTTFLLEDSVWQGGYRSPAGKTYGGRTATWIYGASTAYSTMRASFEVPAQPAGKALVSVEGMDSEGHQKTHISISVNGVEIYRGENPLPDDDQPLETGTWATYTWSFDAALLKPGRNEISISNLDPGAFSLPPFFMLDYATIAYQTP